ncbi:MAG TPA: ATP-binding protein, partial [Pirellulaceae bacterium]|nr:ATP-binding protein [Pirellulaceae bacterium]
SDLIDSLLFLARADNPREQLALRPTVVANELRAVCEFYEAATQEVGVELRGPEVVADSDSADAVVAPIDSTLFRRAVSNLIANAIAHTPRGGSVSVEARRVGSRVSITVSDTGVGIAPEHLPHVFERFYRADSARQSHGGNVGLGLPLVKTIAKLHGGGCSIRSEVGQGTRVELDLPACDAAAV